MWITYRIEASAVASVVLCFFFLFVFLVFRVKNESKESCISTVAASKPHYSASLGDPENCFPGGDSCDKKQRVLIGNSSVALDTEGGFFQSKLSVAEKLTVAHTRKLAKRSGVDLSQLDTEGLTASQIALAAMTAAKEVQPYSVAYESEKTARISTTDAPTITFDQKTGVISGLLEEGLKLPSIVGDCTSQQTDLPETSSVERREVQRIDEDENIAKQE
ncbi:hypothetical protein Aperf_G00000091631 [Anoplocephala perfoliata]